VTFAFELGDDPILIVGSAQKIKKRGTVHAMNPLVCGEIRRFIPPGSTNDRE